MLNNIILVGTKVDLCNDLAKDPNPDLSKSKKGRALAAGPKPER